MGINDLVKGVVLGVAVTVAVPLLLKSSRGQALGKAVLRTGEILAEKASDFASEVAEIADDALAEWQQAEQEAIAANSANDDHPTSESEQRMA